MKSTCFIGNGLLLGWLLALSGCGLFRNTSKHRESARMEHRQSAQRSLDSTTYLSANTTDFSVLVTRRVTETGIGFVAEGNAVIRSDGTVSADKVRGVFNRTDVRASTESDESYQQKQVFQTVSEANEIRQSTSLERDTVDRKSKPNWTLLIALLIIGITAGVFWSYRKHA